MAYVEVPSSGHARSSVPTRGRLLPSFAERGGWTSLAEHRRRFPTPPPLQRGPDESLIDAVERAGLRGRGGAAFPTAAKLTAVARGTRRPVVLANGCEGEPASFKDAVVMSAAPNLVLDGALLAASAVGADEVIVAVGLDKVNARRALARAVEERRWAEPATARLRIVDVPAAYIAGEERALVNFVDHRRAVPPRGTARPFERGVGGRPTLVSNVETLARMATIAAGRSAPEGSANATGTLLVSIGGSVARPGVYEIALGTPFGELLGAAGGPTEELGAVLTGGYAGAWLRPEQALATTVDPDGLASAEGFLGCGAFLVLPAAACGLNETSAVIGWLAGETAGQCGPCVFGLAAIAGATEALAAGRADRRTLERLERWGGDVVGRGACRHPDGAVRFLRSAIRTFAADVERHASGHPCIGARRPPMAPTPMMRRPA